MQQIIFTLQGVKGEWLIFNDTTVGAAMNSYLQMPAAFKQYCEDCVVIQPSASHVQMMKGAQELKNRFFLFMCLIQPAYYGTGTTEYGKIVCNEMNLESGLGFNIANDEQTALLNDFCNLNKIVRKLLDNEKVEEENILVVYVNQYCYLSINSGADLSCYVYSPLGYAHSQYCAPAAVSRYIQVSVCGFCG